MNISKFIKDIFRSVFNGKDYKGLYELSEYFRQHGPINFEYHKENDDVVVAVSTNFAYGSIVTSGKDDRDLDKNIKDAILTSFDLSSIYLEDSKLYKIGEKKAYALA